VGLHEKLIELLFVESPDDFSIKHRGRRHRTKSEAVDLLERYASVSGRIAERYAKARFSTHRKRIAARGLTRFCTAQLKNMASRRRIAKIMIKSHDAMHFGARYVQRVGDHRQRFTIDISKLLLHRMQDRKQRTFLALVFGNYSARALR